MVTGSRGNAEAGVEMGRNGGVFPRRRRHTPSVDDDV
jgi:hypothetical protein